MKKMLLLPLSLLLLFCQAQKNMSRGKIILKQGDTVSALINERSITDNKLSIETINEKTGEKVWFPSDGIKLISLGKKQEDYQPWSVRIDLSYIDKIDLEVRNEDSSVQTTLLLKKIFNGTKMDLYCSYTATKEYFFIYSNNTIEPLIVKYKTYEAKKVPNYENLYRQPKYIILPYYRNQLLKYFDWENNKKLARKVDDLLYDKNKILDVIKEIDKSQ